MEDLGRGLLGARTLLGQELLPVLLGARTLRYPRRRSLGSPPASKALSTPSRGDEPRRSQVIL